MKVIWPQNFLSLPHYFLLNKNVFNCHVNQSYQKIVFWGIIDFWIFLEFYNIERGGSEIIVAFYSVKVLLFD